MSFLVIKLIDLMLQLVLCPLTLCITLCILLYYVCHSNFLHFCKFYIYICCKLIIRNTVITIITIWDQEANICSIIEFSCPLDININKKVNEKLENYGPLFRTLQIMYPKYKF